MSAKTTQTLEERLKQHTEHLTGLQKLLYGCEATLDNFRNLLRQEEERRLSLSVQIAREEDKVSVCKNDIESVKQGIPIGRDADEEARKERARRWAEEEREEREARKARLDDEEKRHREAVEMELNQARVDVLLQKEQLEKEAAAREVTWKAWRQREAAEKALKNKAAPTTNQTPQTQSVAKKRIAPASEPALRQSKRRTTASGKPNYQLHEESDYEEEEEEEEEAEGFQKYTESQIRSFISTPKPPLQTAKAKKPNGMVTAPTRESRSSSTSSVEDTPVASRGRGVQRARRSGGRVRGGATRGGAKAATAAAASDSGASKATTTSRGAVSSRRRTNRTRGGRVATRGRLVKAANLAQPPDSTRSQDPDDSDDLVFLSERKIETPTRVPAEPVPTTTPEQKSTPPNSTALAKEKAAPVAPVAPAAPVTPVKEKELEQLKGVKQEKMRQNAGTFWYEPGV